MDLTKPVIIDRDGREWHVYEREGGSVVIYYTTGNASVHFVVWDSLDQPKPHKGIAAGSDFSEMMSQQIRKDPAPAAQEAKT